MNIEVTVANTKREQFEKALALIAMDINRWDQGSKKEKYVCEGYFINDNKLYLSKYSENAIKFPYEFNLQQTIEFAWGWYENNKKPKAHEPDTDGSTEIAFEITTKGCGVGSFDWGLFCSIEPIWFIYGK
jgi:hypothetical protein